MPLTKLQSHVLRLLAAGRSLDSFVAGGVAINRDGPRYSRDVDLFHDSEARLAEAADADGRTLEESGLRVTWGKSQTGKRQARVEGSGEAMQLEWVADSAFRFFPAQRDETFGYVLHPVDLATNKAAASADRREPRDIVDLLTIHETILPLGAVVCAAVGRFPGQSPEEMLADIVRHSRFTADEFHSLAIDPPPDVNGLHRRIRAMLEDARDFIAKLPSDAVGLVFLDGDRPVQPGIESLAKYRRQAGTLGGVWPSSTEVGRSMLERYAERNPNT